MFILNHVYLIFLNNNVDIYIYVQTFSPDIGAPLESKESTLLILMAHGAPGKPGKQVLNADISENVPRPQVLMPATRNLYAVPGCSSTFFIWV